MLTGDIDDNIQSLLEFKKKLAALKHYYTRYRSAEELKWLFSRQLDKLYGDTQGLSLEITETTPQSQIDTIALVLMNRFLSEVDAHTTIDSVKLGKAVERANEQVRHTIFLRAQQVRRDNWERDKLLMARAIPVLQALIRADPHKHYYFGQLAYALKDSTEPNWQAAKENFDKAIDLVVRARGPAPGKFTNSTARSARSTSTRTLRSGSRQIQPAERRRPSCLISAFTTSVISWNSHRMSVYQSGCN